MADMTSVDAILKEMYLPPIKEQLNNTNRTLVQFDENTEDVVGREVVLPLHTNRNSGVGFRNTDAGDSTPTPGAQGWANAKATTHELFARGFISNQMLAKMATDQGAFLRALPSEQDPLIDDAKRRLAFHVFGDGTGQVAQAGVTTSSTTVQLAASTERRALLILQEGARVDIGTVGGLYADVATARLVTSVDLVNKTITISGAAVTTTSSDFVVFTEEGGAIGASQKVITGLKAIIDDTSTVFQVNPVSQPKWAAYTQNVAGEITVPILEQAVDEAEIRGGAQVDLLITTHGIRRRYAALLQDQIRYTDLSLKGGFNADLTLMVGAAPIPMIVDRVCNEGYIYGVTRKEVNQYIGQDWQFITNPGTGSVLHFDIDTATWHFLLQKQLELATGKRNAHFKLTGVSES